MDTLKLRYLGKLSPIPQTFKWTVFSNHNDSSIDDDICLTDNAVYWRTPSFLGHVEQVFRPVVASNENVIIDSVWTRFRNDSIKTLIILHSCGMQLRIYNPKGSVYDVPLPISMSKLWAIEQGIILQRAVMMQASDLATNTDRPPVLYSLFHPLEEPKPISITSSSFDKLMNVFSMEESPPSESGSLSDFYVTDCDLEVVYISPKRTLTRSIENKNGILMVSWHKIRCEHSIWIIREENASINGGLTIPTIDNDVMELENHEKKIFNTSKDSLESFLPRDDANGTLDPDHTLSAEISIDLVWTDNERLIINRSSDIFIGLDASNESCLYFFDRERAVLHAFAVSATRINQVKLLFQINDVADVAPIVTTNEVSYLLILNHKGELHLNKGDVLLSRCEILADDIGQRATLKVISLSHPVGDRINVTLDDGTDHRFQIPVEFTSPVVFKLFQVLENNLSYQSDCNDLNVININTSSIQPLIQLRGDVWRCRNKLSSLSQLSLSNNFLFENDLELNSFYAIIIHLFCPSLLKIVNNSDDKCELAWGALQSNSFNAVHDSKWLCANALGKSSESAIPENVLHSWSWLHHIQTPSLRTALPMKSCDNQTRQAIAAKIFLSIHLVYEDYKLTSMNERETYQLGQLLYVWSQLSGALNYASYYLRDCNRIASEFGGLNEYFEDCNYCFKAVLPSNPPNIYKLLDQCLRGSVMDNYPTSTFLRISHHLIQLYKTLSSKHLEDVVLKMVELGFRLLDLSFLPFGVSIPLWEALTRCRAKPPSNWPPAAYVLIGREDLAAINMDSDRIDKSNCEKFLCEDSYLLSIPSPMTFLSNRTKEHYTLSSTSSIPIIPALNADNEFDIDGLLLVENGSRLRFGADRRMKEVCTLLSSSAPIVLDTSVLRPNLSEAEMSSETQKLLKKEASRTMALSVGRGMVTFSTVNASLAQCFPIPKIDLSGRLPSNGAVVSMDTTNFVDFDRTILWPDFHNGVSSGLRLFVGSGSKKLTRNWILFNRPPQPHSAHSGFLLAIGLQKQLNVLLKTDIYSYLEYQDEAVSTSLLLGLSAGKSGTKDPTVAKSLLLHIPSLFPRDVTDGLDQSPCVQTAALLGVGLLYQSSAHRLMTEFLLEEIGRKPRSDKITNREGYALAAGLALGMVALGAGSKPGKGGLGDMNIEERLHKMITGGKNNTDSISSFKENMNHNTEGSDNCSRIYEGDKVNVNITAPAAILAMGLIYIRSNNESVADRLKLPNSRFLLGQIRPDLLCLRVLSRNIVMWDDVKATETWFDDQFPSLLTVAFDSLIDGIAVDQPDNLQVKMAHANILAGICFSLGICYAGTGDFQAHALLLKKCNYLKQLRGSCQSPNNSTLEACMSTVAISIAIVMAGTGNLETLKMLRSLRSIFGVNVSYGTHLALNSAIGLLFLSGGTATLGRTNTCVAALVTAFFPVYPRNAQDNQYHLQAFRHLYILAVEQRFINVVDVDSEEPCYVHLEIDLKETETHAATTIKLTAPTILPEYENIVCMRVNSTRYWPLYLSQHEIRNIQSHKLLFVKRRAGHLPYSQDPKGLRSVLAWPFKKVQSLTKQASSRTLLYEDNTLEEFSRYYSQLSVPAGYESNQFLDDFLPAVIYECLTKEKSEMINIYKSIYLTLVDLLSKSRSPVSSSNTIQTDIRKWWNIKLLISYYNGSLRQEKEGNTFENLIQENFLQSIQTRVEEFFDTLAYELTTSETSDLRICLNCREWKIYERILRDAPLLGAYLVFYDIPGNNFGDNTPFSGLTIQNIALYALSNRDISPEALLKIFKITG